MSFIMAKNLFKDKLCWISGASSGIGEALAIELSKQGAKLVLSSSRPEKLERVANECLNHTDYCKMLAFDLSQPAEVEKSAKEFLHLYGTPFLLIHNGGISQRSMISETSMELHRKIMEIDFFSYVAITKIVLPKMIEAKEGYIAATSSISGKFGFPMRSAYASAKHAIQGFFETLRIEMSEHNISVTVAYPGRVRTNISFNALKADGTPHGVLDPGQAGGISSEKCAKKYIKAISKKRAEVLIGGKELLMVHIKRFFPCLFFRIVKKIKPT